MKLYGFLALLLYQSVGAGSVLDTLGIRVGPSREFVYTNGRTAYLIGESGGAPRSGWHGFHVEGRELLDGYTLLVGPAPLPIDSSAQVTIFPDFLRRTYPNGIVEELHPLDSIDAFVVVLRSPRPVSCTFFPWITDARDTSALEIRLVNEAALFARRSHLARSSPSSATWLAIHSPGATPAIADRKEGRRWAPIFLHAPKGREHLFIVAAGRTPKSLAAEARRIPGLLASAFHIRRERMERLLRESEFRSADERFDRGLAWAKLSLDALIMRQGPRGIFAGLPWFNNYWGRDTFIALPGATLVTGRCDIAREILAGFASEQQRDTASSDYGRIPNFVGPGERGYNTADGTPRFVIQARELVERSGDRGLIEAFYPAVIRSIEGTLTHHCDSLGFLTHADAETWMDAVGPDGPWSPRGNRGNDIQALWAQQLEAGVWFATKLGDVGSAVRWNAALALLKHNFLPYFLRRGVIADRLKPDGTPDMTLRPNQIFLGDLLPDDLRARVLSTVVSRLAYPYGVASLAQEEGNFHPYHEHPPFYPKDAAYHNGTVWTWLQGRVIGELCRFGFADTAWRLTSESVHQILDRGAVGTQGELLDALPRPGMREPNLSGTISQAWNLAEFVRNVYEDYLGIRADGLARSIVVTPSLPDRLGTVEARIPFLDGAIWIRSWMEGERRFAFRSEGISGPVPGELRLRTGLRSGRSVRLTIRPGPFSTAGAEGINLPFPEYPSKLPPPALATPRLREGLISLRGPSYPLLSASEVKAENPTAPLVARATDPEGDDRGITGGARYLYPQSPLFVPGSFDLREFEVREDSLRLYFSLRFRALSDPGWHPEYGFQLTYAAIAIDTDGLPGSGASDVGENAVYRLPRTSGFERLVLIGGGVRVLDDSGRILCAYTPLPADVAHPLGDASSGVISFALPRALFPGPVGRWTFTLLAGAQDDHGGAGIGEFRTVQPIPSEWNGGGRANPDLPNVYDLLLVPPSDQ